MIDPSALHRRAAPIDRSSDRLIALAAIVIAIAYLLAAAITLLLPPADRVGAWLPLHLALAGAATTAIAGVMPFFVAAFAAAPPSDARLRSAAVGCVAVGALLLAIGMMLAVAGVAVAGGVGFLIGIVLTGAAAVRPLGHGLGPSRGIVTRGYVLALLEVTIGASLATLFLAGWPPVVEAWLRLKPAHAWLNLVGFVSLVVATTLLHFFPTVIGARIANHPSARLTVAGLAAGAAVVALGFALASDIVVRVGAIAVLVGAASLAVYALRTWRTRATWTTDPGWHRFAMGGLVSSIAWFEMGMAVADRAPARDRRGACGLGGRRRHGARRLRLDRPRHRRLGEPSRAGRGAGRPRRPRAPASDPGTSCQSAPRVDRPRRRVDLGRADPRRLAHRGRRGRRHGHRLRRLRGAARGGDRRRAPAPTAAGLTYAKSSVTTPPTRRWMVATSSAS